MEKFSFPGSLKLKGLKLISSLFEQGYSVSKSPLRMVWLFKQHTTGTSIKAGFTVSKKYFKKAVDRNLIKRRMREAFRLNKHILQEHALSHQELDLMFVYNSTNILNYTDIESAMKFLLDNLNSKIIKTE